MGARLVTTFSVDGVEYVLRLRMTELKAYQRATGETAVAAFNALEAEPGDMVRFSAMFRAACNPALSEEEADALIDALGLGEASRLLGEAAKEASPNSPAPQEA
jgi:hypothetical protein